MNYGNGFFYLAEIGDFRLAQNGCFHLALTICSLERTFKTAPFTLLNKLFNDIDLYSI
jgi:hypothetical protein